LSAAAAAYAARDSDRAALEAALAGSRNWRPDLRALQFGYQSQEQNLRKAVAGAVSESFARIGVSERHDECPHISSARRSSALCSSQSGRDRGPGRTPNSCAPNIRRVSIKRRRRLADMDRDAAKLNGAIADIAARLPELQLAARMRSGRIGGRFAGFNLCETLPKRVFIAQSELSDLRQSLGATRSALSSFIGTQSNLLMLK